MTADRENGLLLFPIIASVAAVKPGVRMGTLGFGWQGAEMADETYYEVAGGAPEAARRFRERTKTGSNGHDFHVGRGSPPSPASLHVLGDFLRRRGSMSLGRYYRDFDDDELVVRFMENGR